MKVSAISQTEECKPRRNAFISYSNSFMSVPTGEDPAEKTGQVNPDYKKMGIEELQNSSIFPKEVIGGKTVIIA